VPLEAPAERFSAGAVERLDRIPEMIRADVLVPHRHPRIAVAKDRHDGSLRYRRHRQRACGVVTDVVKAEILEPEAPHQAREAPREYLGVTLGEDVRLTVK